VNSSSTSTRRALAVVTAVVGTVVVWLIGRQLVGGALEVESGGNRQTVTVVSVIVASVLAGLVGWGLLAILERVTSKARTIWLAIAVVFLLISLLGPLGGVTPGTKITLILLHLAAAGAIIPAFVTSSTRS
jgi:hypothetical protein